MVTSAQLSSIIDANRELRRADLACREAQENWRYAIAQLARIDQQDAKLRDQGLATLAELACSVVARGKALLRLLVLRAERQQLRDQIGQLKLESKPSETSPELDASDNDWTSLEPQARGFVNDCAGHVDSCLRWQIENFASGDVEAARMTGVYACRIIAAMREIMGSWPWTDWVAIEDSHRQHQQGQLMDFETFKHELLKAAR